MTIVNPFGGRTGQEAHVQRKSCLAIVNAPLLRAAVCAHLAQGPGWRLNPDNPRSVKSVDRRQALGNVALQCVAESGRHTDPCNKALEFALGSMLLEPGIAAGPLTAKLGYERPEGKGLTAVALKVAMHDFRNLSGNHACGRELTAQRLG